MSDINDNNTPEVNNNTEESVERKIGAKLRYNYINSSVSVDPTSYKISMPSLPMEEFNTKVKEFSRLDLDENDLNEWKSVCEEATELYTPNALYQDRFLDPESLFEQGVEDKTNNLKSITNLKFKQTDGELKGEVAVLKVAKMLGLGDVLSIPLPHSGIWITLKPPTERDLIDFYNSIFRDKIILGRATSGLTLSNLSVYINNKLVDFIINHIHSLNYNDIDKTQLKNFILINDLPILAWGFACTIYPDGFDFQRACVEDIEKCDYIAKEVINMTKLLWIDNSSLTDLQKDLLNENRPNKLTIDDYNKYISEHSRTRNKSYTLSNGIKLYLKVPTINEYIGDGLKWVNKINSSVEKVVIETDAGEEDKERLLEQYVKASSLIQFNHFVDYLEVDDSPITDRDTINNVLEVLSGDDEIRNEILQKILDFKSETIISLIGIPEYKCPKCNSSQNQSHVNEKFINVIPLDVMNIFFILITIRITKIMERTL